MKIGDQPLPAVAARTRRARCRSLPGYNDVLLRAVPLAQRTDHLADVQRASADVAKRRNTEVVKVLLQGLEDAARHERLQTGAPRGRPYRGVLPDLVAQPATLYRRYDAVLGARVPPFRRYTDVLQGRATKCLLVRGDLRVTGWWIRRIHGKQEDVDAEYHYQREDYRARKHMLLSVTHFSTGLLFFAPRYLPLERRGALFSCLSLSLLLSTHLLSTLSLLLALPLAFCLYWSTARSLARTLVRHFVSTGVPCPLLSDVHLGNDNAINER